MDPTRRLALLRDQKGFALVYVALIIFVLFGFLGLAVDAGHLYVVRGELQNAADASALAGASALYTGTPPTLETYPFPNTTALATSFISQNKSDKTTLSTGIVETGYWDDDNKIFINNNTNPTTSPAVAVTINRSVGNNGGAVAVFFAKILPGSLSTAAVSSTKAVAIRGFAGSVPPGAPVLPLALSGCMTEDFFKKIPPPPTIVTIGTGTSAAYEYSPGCTSGAWTTLATDSSSARVVASLIDAYNAGTTSEMHAGETIYIKPGVAASDYGAMPVGKDVILPIVGDKSQQASDLPSWQIRGFAWFHIDVVVSTGPEKYVKGHFISLTDAPTNSQAGGSASNALALPQMVR